MSIPEPFRSVFARAERDRIVMGTVQSIDGHRESSASIPPEELAERYLDKSWAARFQKIPADATFEAAEWQPGQERPAWNNIDLACRVLGRLAGQATPGPWQEAVDDHGAKHGTDSGVWSDGPRRYVVETTKPGNPNYVNDARYIAAVDPYFADRVLTLLRAVQDMAVEQRPHTKSEMDVVLAACDVAKKVVDESGYPFRRGGA